MRACVRALERSCVLGVREGRHGRVYVWIQFLGKRSAMSTLYYVLCRASYLPLGSPPQLHHADDHIVNGGEQTIRARAVLILIQDTSPVGSSPPSTMKRGHLGRSELIYCQRVVIKWNPWNISTRCYVGHVCLTFAARHN